MKISSDSQYKHIVEYLNDSSANSKNNFGIPIAYKWHSGLFQKFRSLSSDDSPDLDDKLKHYITSGFIKQLFGPVYDSLVLLNSEN